ncbi:LamG domain-containing protein [Micromonospora coxensis]|uniref:LamG domain-containing protein n=1 Tax=Micromonospora coxensis TaxID=356852 RepID=UPI003416D3DB
MTVSWRRRAFIWLTSISAVVSGTGFVAETPAVSAAPGPAEQAACVTEAPDEAAAARLAARCGRAVEVLSERTEYAQVTVGPDGVRKLVASVAPQRVRRANGTWAAIDPNLRPKDGRLSPVATLSDVSFSTGGTGPLVTWREAGSSFTLEWPLGPLPVPRVDGATAVYPSVLKDVNLHVTATAEGYTHVVEVLTPEAAAQPAIRALRFRTGGDMKVTQDATGTVRLTTAGGVPVANSAPARMWDSSTDPSRAGEVLTSVASAEARGLAVPAGERATAAEAAVTSRSARVGVTVSGAQLTVTPDAKLMAEPGLTYPIFIDPEFEKQRSKWAYATSNGENNDTTSARVGRQPYPEGGNGERYHSFYDFPISGLKGKQILGSTVRVTLDHSWSCTPTWVHAYRTSAITVASGGRMGWTTRPLPSNHLDAWEGSANEAGGCGSVQPDVDAEFASEAFRNDLQYAVNKTWPTYTVGLCACNDAGEGEDLESRWKKFYTDKAWLEVTYNSKPSVPSKLATSDQVCGATIGTASPVFEAFYGDADGTGDSLTGYFEYMFIGYSGVGTKTGQTKPGNSFGDSGTVSLGSLAEGRTYQWRVQTRDKAGSYSDWSGWCSFTVDLDKPLPPAVSSTDYPADGSAHGGPGVAGTFTFIPRSTDVAKHVYGWSGQTGPLTTIVAGSRNTVTLTPPRFGFNVLEVYSIDGANKLSDTTRYKFLVEAPSAPIAHWPLDRVDSHDLKEASGGPSLSVNGTEAWADNSRIYGDATPSFNLNTHLAADVPLDTAKSFGVAVWVNLGDATREDPEPVLSPGNWTAVSKFGTKVSGFYLGYRLSNGPRWSFMMPGADAASSANTFVAVESPTTLTTKAVGKWAHLAASYDAATREMVLYVNGKRVASGVRPAAGWNAGGPVVIGGAQWSVNPTDPTQVADHWLGQITDVRLWNRALTQDDLTGTDVNPEMGTEAVPGIIQPIQVANWDFNGGLGSACGSAASYDYWGRSLDLYGCTDPYSESQTVGYTGDGYDDSEALWLNTAQPDGWGGASTRTGYAATTDPVVNTGQSLTISAAVRVHELNGQEQVFVKHGAGNAQEGAVKLYMEQNGNLRFAVLTPDGAGGVSWAAAVSDSPLTAATVQAKEWVHLTGVFDVGTGEVRLYVDGWPQAVRGVGAVGKVSSHPLFVGSVSGVNSFLRGDIDQIKVYAGAMNDREAAALYRDSR